MAGTFIIGEQKIRPGSYFNIGTKDGYSADVINGVTAVIFRSDFGPVGEAVELSRDEGYADVFGTGGTTDAIQEALNGGAKTIIACRLGNGGTVSSVILKDADNEDAVTVSTKYPGSKSFHLTIREKITDFSVKECIIYCGVKEFEKVTFAAGNGETKALAEALAATSCFSAVIADGKEDAVLLNVSQDELSGGSDPAITTEAYSDAFELVEPYVFNTICVDTEDSAVHLLLQAFINRIFENGSFTQAVVAEKSSLDIKIRENRAVSYNDEKMNYVLNPRLDVQGTVIDGYQTAARIAGMIGSVPSNQSLTHAIMKNCTDILERLTPAQITKAETKGCIVLSMNSDKQVWIDNAINTLITPAENQDKGWKKIRRVKTRFEMLRRCNQTTDRLVGKVDNDTNGRKTIISNLNGVGADMVSEGKLNYFKASESYQFESDGDSCWFDVDVVDKDSAEHIYAMYEFQFSTNLV